jgi:hypothetical protein
MSTQTTRAIGRNYHGYYFEGFLDCLCKGTYRQLTSPAEGRQHCSFAGHSLAGRLIIELCAYFTSRVAFPRLNGQSALARSGTHSLGRENFGNLMSESKPAQSCSGEHNGIILALFQFPKPRIDISADRLNVQIRPENSKLCRSTPGTGTYGGAVRNLIERVP